MGRNVRYERRRRGVESGRPAASPRLPPGPRGWELLALVPHVLRSPLAMIARLVERYGDVVCVGSSLFWLVWRPEHVEHVLVANGRNYGKGASVQTARAVFGDGLVTSDGALWRRQRRLLQPAFTHERVAAFHPLIVDATARMLDGWEAAAERATPIDMTQEMLRLSEEIISRTLLGVQRSDGRGLTDALEVVERYIDRRAWNPFRWTEKLPTPLNRRFRRSLETIEMALYDLIRDHRAHGRGSDVLSLLLEGCGVDVDSGNVDRQVRDELMTVFFTGVGTTAYALSWVWCLLGANAAVEQRVYEEAVAVLGCGVPTIEEVERLSLTRRVFDEALRLYPPAWITARTAREDDEIGGFRVAAGTPVLLAPYVTHRHPALWREPTRFDPDRWLTPEVAERPAFAYYPFGGGQRQCLGRFFGLLQARTVIGMVVRRYRLEALPGSTVRPKTATVLKPQGGVWMVPRRRG